jgi:hypothetical protein
MCLLIKKNISFVILILFCVLNSRNFLYAQNQNTHETLAFETSFPTLKNEQKQIQFIKDINTTFKTIGLTKKGIKNFWINYSNHNKELKRILINLNILNDNTDEFFIAVNQGNINKIDDILTKNNTNLINMVDPKTKMRPMQTAIIKSDDALIWYLIAQGVNLNISDEKGENIFYKLAHANNNIALLEYLVEHNFANKSEEYQKKDTNPDLTLDGLKNWLDRFEQNRINPKINQIFNMYHANIKQCGFFKMCYSYGVKKRVWDDFDIKLKIFAFILLSLLFLFCRSLAYKIESNEDNILLRNLPFLQYYPTYSTYMLRISSILIIAIPAIIFLWHYLPIFLHTKKEHNDIRQSMIFVKNNKGNNILNIAITKKRHDILWYLAVNYPLLFKQQDERFGKTALHYLVQDSRYLPILKYLIKIIPLEDMKKKDHKRKTPIYYAYATNNEKIVRLLLNIDFNNITGLDNEDQRKLKILLEHETNNVVTRVYKRIYNYPQPAILFNNAAFRDVLPIIFENFSSINLVNCFLVNREFNKLAKNAACWKNLLIKQFGENAISNIRMQYPRSSWFEIYRILRGHIQNWSISEKSGIKIKLDGTILVLQNKYGHKTELEMHHNICDAFLCLHHFIAIDIFGNILILNENSLEKFIIEQEINAIVKDMKITIPQLLMTKIFNYILSIIENNSSLNPNINEMNISLIRPMITIS